MRKFFKLLTIFLLSSNLLFSQKKDKVFDKEFHLEVDNDSFVPPSFDRYYTSGVRFSYRAVAKEGSWLDKIFNKDTINGRKKILYNFVIGHHTYTPQSISLTDVQLFDRPYAGWLYGGVGLNTFFSSRLRLALDFDAGLVGPATGIGDFQEWYHELVGFPIPRGWEFEIQNGAALNLNGELNYELVSLPEQGVSIVSNTSFRVGTIFDNFRQGATIRLFNFRPLDESAFFHAKLGEGLSRSQRKQKQKKEIYLFYTYTYERVFHNTLIEGNVLGESSPHLETIEPNINHHRVGFAISGVGVDWHFSVHRNSAETTEAEGQTYGTVEIVARF